MNKIALFTISPFSLTSLLIAAVTRCPFSHAAICIGGVWYHASESTGYFSEMDVSKFKNRHCTVFTFGGDLSRWLANMDGTEYDWEGIRGWARRLIGFKYSADDRKFYCFEAAISGLLTARLTDSSLFSRGGTLRTMLDNNISSLIGRLEFNKSITDQQHQFIFGARKIGKTTALINKVVELITAKQVSGCDISKLFTVSKTGRFGDLS